MADPIQYKELVMVPVRFSVSCGDCSETVIPVGSCLFAELFFEVEGY